MEIEGSKSIINRVLIISSFLQKPLKIKNISHCDDVQTLIENLKIFGMKFEINEDKMLIIPTQKFENHQSYFIKDAGTAFRFLLAKFRTTSKFMGKMNISNQLKNRPIKPLTDLLEIDVFDYPFELLGKKITKSHFEIKGDISSQFISSLLLSVPNFPNDLQIIQKGKMVSQKYVDMTISIMNDFGIKVEKNGRNIFVKAGQNYKNLTTYEVEPDFSSACYFWAFSALTGKKIEIKTSVKKSIQPDFNFLQILGKMGAKINFQNNVIWIEKDRLNGIEIDMSTMPDQVPTLSILALFASSKTVIKNISHLQFKESNRIENLIFELSKIGAKIVFQNGKLMIEPLNNILKNAKLKTFNDHRLVMSFHLLKALIPNIQIENFNAENKSFPKFFEEFNKLLTQKDVIVKRKV
ncbi:MAG: 3-phosphoshikimate 1-carboxyvinyltransferase [Candidatus Cloacimonetes bacterium]|jgi:3-phosphoshikimate 1-carboxyvinyltransferase|nr:3-phosphoshikimate 1-carboxyvinyltransferase [Candidatus Cloacimonadota bacterium]MBT6994442.1 3-phosphoshikimate 1-carboxyvinyltransferase [Candidatus Cloacimonadota bacterium]MBT7469014.1 3-phosphoshikimate 1-carboxyvinyltransferase [Candidatus Cloacimonadota bacterium]